MTLPPVRSGATMNYETGKMKVAELVGYFAEGRMNMIPPFQRGRVWSTKLRQKLLENMVKGKPIPAIFLYLTAEGSSFTYNILDGKQRLESLLLFVGDFRSDMAVPTWRNYFFKGHKDAGFKINVAEAGERTNRKKFADLDDEFVRNFREYSIPTVEITLSEDDAGLKEVIDLFIDINSYGVRVKRFDIVRTMYEDNRLLADIFKLVGQRQRRKKDYFYKMVDSDYTFVLKRLQIVNFAASTESEERYQERVDRMWEKLLEIVLFIRSKQHRTLAQILKAFTGERVDSSKLTKEERKSLRKLFSFLRSVYGRDGISKSRLATDQPHNYTMLTAIHGLDLIGAYGKDELGRKLREMANLVDGKRKAPDGKGKAFKEYMDLSSAKTTHPGRRTTRQALFAEILQVL
jgi:hypothetical protein